MQQIADKASMGRVYTDGGFVNGFIVPKHAILDLTWLPSSPAGALVTLHGNGLTQHIFSREVADVSFSSNGATFFSHRAGTAAIATLVDRWLAGWSGYLTFHNGDHIAWTAVAGPPPSPQLLAGLQACLDNSKTPASRVRFMNEQINVGEQHDMTLLRSSAQAEAGDPVLPYLTTIEEMAERGSFPYGRHILVTGDQHGVTMALSLAIFRFMRDTLDCHVNMLAIDPDTFMLDADPELTSAAAAVTRAGGLLWINAYKHHLHPQNAWGKAIQGLILEPGIADHLALVVTVDLSATSWLAGRGVPVVHPY